MSPSAKEASPGHTGVTGVEEYAKKRYTVKSVNEWVLETGHGHSTEICTLV